MVRVTYQVGGVNLAVPVYRPQNWEALEQARLSVIQSEAQLAAETTACARAFFALPPLPEPTAPES